MVNLVNTHRNSNKNTHGFVLDENIHLKVYKNSQKIYNLGICRNQEIGGGAQYTSIGLKA